MHIDAFIHPPIYSSIHQLTHAPTHPRTHPPSCPVTLIDSQGNIKTYPEGHPHTKIVAACLGLCGIILEVVVKFNPSTDAVEITRGRRSLSELIPPRDVPINDSYNPLKWFIEGPGKDGGALSYAPYNSAPEVGMKLDASKIHEYHSKDRIWSNAVRKLPVGGWVGGWVEWAFNLTSSFIAVGSILELMYTFIL